MDRHQRDWEQARMTRYNSQRWDAVSRTCEDSSPAQKQTNSTAVPFPLRKCTSQHLNDNTIIGHDKNAEVQTEMKKTDYSVCPHSVAGSA